MNRRIRLAAAAVAIGFALPAAVAQAHVTLDPPAAKAGAFVVETLRVPTERDDAVTTKLDVKLPDGLAAARPKVVRGWSVAVRHAKLARPVQTPDGPIDEQVSRIIWTARSRADAIPAGQYEDFPVSLVVPAEAGHTLAFKALQTYSDGKVVRWIGAAGDAQPAATLSVTAAGGAGSPTAPGTAADSDDSGDRTLAIVALALALMALAVGGAALRSRPTKEKS